MSVRHGIMSNCILLTFIQPGDCGAICGVLIWQVRACDGIKAYAESLMLGVSQDSSSHFPQLHGSLVEHSVIGVVPQTVGYHEIKIAFQISHGDIFMSLQSVMHFREVHWLGNKLQIIWYLLKSQRKHKKGTKTV